MRVYLIGSLRNAEVPALAQTLRSAGHEVFDSWYAAGPEADDYWQRYVTERGLSYDEALREFAAQHVFNFDKAHLDRADAVVLVLPAGKSGHLELGYSVGKGRRAFILLPPGDVGRYDVMYAFAEKVCATMAELIEALKS